MKRPRRTRTEGGVRDLARALGALERTPDRQALEDAERYVCAWCSRPLRTCGTGARCACTEKMREGTVLTAVRRQSGRERPRCLSCGRLLPATLLRKQPLAEVCASCRRPSSSQLHQRRKEDRNGPKTRGA